MFFCPLNNPDAPFAIAFVGNDGAGKSTLSKAIRSELENRVSVKRIDKWDVIRENIYPEYSFMGNDLPLLRRCTSQMQEVTRTLFLFWTLHGTLKPEVLQGCDVVVLDGYWPKHAASEIRYSGQSALVEAAVQAMPVPNITFFLDIEPAESYRRRSEDGDIPLVPYECGLDQDLSETSFLRHQGAVRDQLVDWSEKFNWHRIDAARPRNEIRAEILDLISMALREKADAAA